MNYFTIQSNLEKMICDITNDDDDVDDDGIQNPKLNYCYRYSTRYSDILLLIDLKSKNTTRRGLVVIHYIITSAWKAVVNTDEF